MKKTLMAFAVVLMMGCFKDPKEWVTGTVVAGPSCGPGAMLVEIDRANSSVYPFLCPNDPAMSYPCSNSVYIMNMPSSLSASGTKIRFHAWTDNGVYCSSSSYSPHYLEVTELSGL
jgi:hypothetical protein